MSKEFCYVVAFQENAKELYAGLVLDVVYYHKQEADFSADNPDDFYGYTQIEWVVARADIFDDNTDAFIQTINAPSKEYCEERFNVDTDYLEAWLIEKLEMEKEDDQ